jgi:hypothetical protein
MSEADAMLKSLLAIDEPPARDAAFTVAVMQRVARRRLWIDMAMLAPVAIAVCVALWALAPSLTEFAVNLVGPFAQGAALPVLAVVLTFVAMALMGRDNARA